jgi:CopG family nickel-responsive transcriptional regulator
MAIISISLNDKIIEEMDYLQDKLGYSGRSEIVRAAIRSFIGERESETLLDKDEVFSGSLIVTLPEHNRDMIHTLQHSHERIIKTQIHQCVSHDRCMNIFVLEGKGKEIKSFIRALEKLPKVETVKFVLAV